jgi:iron(III) transport system permease protein
MITSLHLEQPGRWRAAGLALIVLVITLPALPLLGHVSVTAATVVTGVFASALANSLLVAIAAGAVALIIGLPAGVLAACYEFRGRGLLLAAASLPLLAPSVLWAIGWSALLALPPILGCVLVFATSAVPLVLITAYLASRGLTGSQVDAGRLAGGERRVMQLALQHAATPALVAAGLGGVLTLSDPGPAQIFGLRTGAVEILTSFSALYDFGLAARQCVALTVVALIVAAPVAIIGGPRIARGMLARQVHPLRPVRRSGMTTATLIVMSAFVLVGVIAPVAGLTAPLVAGQAFARALSVVWRTAGDTLLYACGAGVLAVTLGFSLALIVGRQERLRIVALGIMLAVFAVPPAMTALGLVYLGADASAWADPILRSRLTVCIALGLRFLPVAAVIGMWAWGNSSPSWALAAGLHGVPLGHYLRRVLLPFLLPAGILSGMLIALLATADIGTVLLLHPPGAGTLPLAIFTVMANAPESLVASLCVIYISLATLLVAGIWTIAGKQR